MEEIHEQLNNNNFTTIKVQQSKSLAANNKQVKARIDLNKWTDIVNIYHYYLHYITTEH